jgi:hypothetical protein
MSCGLEALGPCLDRGERLHLARERPLLLPHLLGQHVHLVLLHPNVPCVLFCGNCLLQLRLRVHFPFRGDIPVLRKTQSRSLEPYSASMVQSRKVLQNSMTLQAYFRRLCFRSGQKTEYTKLGLRGKGMHFFSESCATCISNGSSTVARSQSAVSYTIRLRNLVDDSKLKDRSPLAANRSIDQ